VSENNLEKRFRQLESSHAAVVRLVDRVGKEGKTAALETAIERRAEKLAEALGRLLQPEDGEW
jgi:hypothetical protein